MAWIVQREVYTHKWYLTSETVTAVKAKTK